MPEKPDEPLFDAFREDHAVLGRGFHELSTRLRAGDVEGAREVAERLDREAGAHIVFEEEHFYPALKALISKEEVDDMYAEHRLGLDVLRRLTGTGPAASLREAERAELLEESETMESHIAECGTLFGAMGGVPPTEQKRLYEALLRLRREHPRWTGYAKEKEKEGGGPPPASA